MRASSEPAACREQDKHSPWLLALLALLLLSACSEQAMMREQPKIEPLEPAAAFAYEQSVRPLPDNVVPREAATTLTWVETGEENGQLVATMPLSVTTELLARGQEQYNIYCSPCHGLAGFGEGMVVQRGFPEPPSFHSIRLREAPDGYLFEVITNGLGQMYGYGPQVEPVDRWAIIAYVRTLQLSQHAPAELLTPVERERVDEEVSE